MYKNLYQNQKRAKQNSQGFETSSYRRVRVDKVFTLT